MKYKKGQLFYIEHKRKGGFYCQAIADFDTSEEFYPLIDLSDGEKFVCRGVFCKLTVLQSVPSEYQKNMIKEGYRMIDEQIIKAFEERENV